jgi:class 3 adenylate cyclase/HAMP domain-containing protein
MWMSIRRRLTLSFIAILALFGLNLLIYFIGKQQQSKSVDTLRRAVASQPLVSSIHESIINIRNEVGFLSQIVSDKEHLGADDDAIAEFNGRLEEIRRKIAELAQLSDPQDRTHVEALANDYRELRSAWATFYENFGVNQSRAIIALATRADPISARLIQQVLPQLQEEEKQWVETASANFNRVGMWTDRISVITFLLSALVAALVAIRVSRYLTHRIEQLKLGASMIGEGQLGHRIPIQSKDELGQLAVEYNSMAVNLQAAREQLTQAHQEMAERNLQLEEQRSTSERLLLNILPVQVARELEDKGMADPKYFEDVTILFTDFVGFTLSTEKLAAEELVYVLHDYFTAFDEISERYDLEKMKTIGDSYMCVGGLPLGRSAVRAHSHPVDAVMAAFEMVQAVVDRDRSGAMARWAVRIGIHTGPVIAGVVGIQKFAFDIWGESVNFASRMEACGSPNQVNLSGQTYLRVKDFFECDYRGKVPTKDRREEDMYFARGVLPGLLEDTASIPPEAFLRRYRIYFQKEPPAFPALLAQPTDRRVA